MGGGNVKNTIVERVLQLLAPHLCCGCGKVGGVICQDCKYDISHEPFWGCFRCGVPASSGVCEKHAGPLERAFIASARYGTLETAINTFKFQHVKGASEVLAEVLAKRLPLLPSSVVLVPIPTVPAHIRERGYDHCYLLARHLGTLTHRPVVQVLERQNTATQHTVGRIKRQDQARLAFRLRKGALLDKNTTYLLVDDIITTGSTILEAASLLRESGATVWAAALAYQPLDV